MSIRVAHILLLLAIIGPAASCSSPKIARIDAELKQNAALADAAYAATDWKQAAALRARALTRARQTDLPAEISAQAYALAACLVNMARWNEAALLLEESAMEARRAGLQQFNINLLRAKLALWQQRPDEATGLANELLAAAKARTTQEAQARILIGQLACEAGDLPNAEANLKTAADILKRNNPNPGIMADCEALKAGVALLEGKPAEAAVAYDAAALFLQTAARHMEMAVMLDRAGAAYAKAADKPRALDRSFRAARSFAAFEDVERAKIAAERARSLADDPRDSALARRLEAMEAELTSTPPEKRQPPSAKPRIEQ